jgi:hypothetical protein
VVLVTFLFGAFLPILFPIALFSLVCLYLTDKFLLAYFYVKPQKYSNKLNMSTITVLKWLAPFCYITTGVVQYAIPEVFRNRVVANEGSQYLYPADWQALKFDDLNDRSPGDLFGLIYFIYICLMIVTPIMQCCKCYQNCPIPLS